MEESLLLIMLIVMSGHAVVALHWIEEMGEYHSYLIVTAHRNMSMKVLLLSLLEMG